MKETDEENTLDILDDAPLSLILPIYIVEAFVSLLGMAVPLASVAAIAYRENASLYYAFTLTENSFYSCRKIYVLVWVFCVCFSIIRMFKVQNKIERTKVFHIIIALLFMGALLSINYLMFPTFIKFLSAV